MEIKASGNVNVSGAARGFRAKVVVSHPLPDGRNAPKEGEHHYRHPDGFLCINVNGDLYRIDTGQKVT